LQKHGGPEKAVAVPPVARTARCATEAQDARGRPLAVLAIDLVGVLR
jgi:hypothetical protein